MNNVKPELQDLTNKFLEDFFVLYAKLDGRKRDDSFVFHYILPDALIGSEFYINDRSNNDDYGVFLTMSSISITLAVKEMEFKSKLLIPKLLFLIDYWQENDTDRSLISLISDKLENAEFDTFDWTKPDMSDLKIGKEKKDFRRVIFKLHNTTNYMDLKVTLDFDPDSKKVKEVRVLNAKGLFFTHTERETKITEYDSIKDVNGLFSALNNVIISIEEKLNIRYEEIILK